MTEGGKPGFWSHWPALSAAAAALLTAIGTLIGGLAAAGIIGGGNGGPGATQPGTETGASTQALPFDATADEERLAEMIPDVHVPECVRADPVAGSTRANLFCTPVEVAGVVYSLFDSITSLNAYMRGRLSLGDAREKCGESASGSSTYTDRDGDTAGRVICYLEKGEAWIEWTNVKASVYAYAYRRDKDWKALFNFWTSSAGPYP